MCWQRVCEALQLGPRDLDPVTDFHGLDLAARDHLVELIEPDIERAGSFRPASKDRLNWFDCPRHFENFSGVIQGRTKPE
jgi:hypothetical protein